MVEERKQLSPQIIKSVVPTRNKHKRMLLLLCFLCLLSHPSSEEDIPGLYKPSDPIVELRNDTIMNALIAYNKVWIVEFYSSWCGHCQAFAPTWLKLAVQLQNWNKYIEVGALNCANERNADICNAFRINAYPTIKYFDYDWRNVSYEKDEDGYPQMGFTLKESQSIATMRNTLIDVIENQTNLKYDKSGISFQPITFTDLPTYMKKKKINGYRCLGLVFEDNDSYIGKNLIMDTSKSKHVVIRKADVEEKSLLKTYDITALPSFVLFHLENGKFEQLSRNNRTYLGFFYSLQSRFSIIATPPTTHEIEEGVKEVATQRVMNTDINKLPRVHIRDLISALMFSLKREVPKNPVIKGNELDALKKWINLLIQCFPAHEPMLSFLHKLETWLKNKGEYVNKVQSADYVRFIKSNDIFPHPIKWVGCRGSEAKFRGFPCALWSLFHTITVSCGSKFSKNTLSGLDVLKRVRGFIDYFFGCRYCRDHFVEMAKNLEREVSTHEDAIMWLWERHNRVNARLKNDISSDPFFPKIQFPPIEMCRGCRKVSRGDQVLLTQPGFGVNTVTWNKFALLDFLRKHYGADNIVANDDEPYWSGKRRFTSRVVHDNNIRVARLSFFGITRLELTLCVAMYISSAGTLIVLYLFFVRRTKKKQWKNIV